MDAVSLAGVSSVAQHGVRLLLFVAEKQEWCFLVCSSGSPSYPVAWSSCWCRLCLATSPSWRLLEEFPLLRALCRAIRTWKSGLRFRPRFFQSFGVWVLPLEYVVFGTRALLGSTVDTCSTRGFWRTSHIFSVWWTQFRGVYSPFRRMEKCAQLMLRVAVSLRAVRTLNLDIISTSSPCDGVGLTHFASFFALFRFSQR